MNESSDAALDRLIDQALAPASPAQEDLVAGGLRAWERLVEQLNPLIGETGLCALYARARYLAAPASNPEPTDPDLCFTAAMLDHLRRGLADMAPAEAAVFNAALFATYTKLLSGLIGTALTARLLHTAWAERPEGKKS
ncbi:MAG: hypothetical protein ABIT83_15195 [Massilia sp.]